MSINLLRILLIHCSTVFVVVNHVQLSLWRFMLCSVKNLDSSTQTDMLFLDFSKVFYSVSHTLLLHQLEFLGFSGKLLAW